MMSVSDFAPSGTPEIMSGGFLFSLSQVYREGINPFDSNAGLMILSIERANVTHQRHDASGVLSPSQLFAD